MSHQDVSVMRALSTKTTLDDGTSCATCREVRTDQQHKTNWCGTLPQTVNLGNSGRIICSCTAGIYTMF